MCAIKGDVKTKMDHLIQAMNSLASVIERSLELKLPTKTVRASPPARFASAEQAESGVRVEYSWT